ncbi:MAG: InlB B-repeat-containing protein [Lachnospiraceae bacterium]|nr:InlB B-repeat-containing protein [Lachnospiraceae bacterium]
MDKKVFKIVTGTAVFILASVMMASMAFAANVTVTFITPGRVTQKVVPQGTDMTYQGPKDINIDGYAFCGWNVALANVQTDTVAYAVYMPMGNESQAVQACNVYHNLPTGVLSYTTTDLSIIPKETRELKAAPTPMASPCRLSAEETIAKNPVGIPGQTCVVKWYNGSTGALCWTDVVWYGTTLPDPADPCIDGYEFVGWYGSWTNITEDRSIMACYYRGRRVFYYDSNGKSLGDKWLRMDPDKYKEMYEHIVEGGHDYKDEETRDWVVVKENDKNTDLASIYWPY